MMLHTSNMIIQISNTFIAVVTVSIFGHQNFDDR
jgi:hypothetical protein